MTAKIKITYFFNDVIPLDNYLTEKKLVSVGKKYFLNLRLFFKNINPNLNPRYNITNL